MLMHWYSFYLASISKSILFYLCNLTFKFLLQVSRVVFGHFMEIKEIWILEHMANDSPCPNRFLNAIIIPMWHFNQLVLLKKLLKSNFWLKLSKVGFHRMDLLYLCRVFFCYWWNWKFALRCKYVKTNCTKNTW